MKRPVGRPPCHGAVAEVTKMTARRGKGMIVTMGKNDSFDSKVNESWDNDTLVLLLYRLLDTSRLERPGCHMPSDDGVA